MNIGLPISVPSDLRDGMPLGHDSDWFPLIFVPFDPGDYVPLEHDCKGFLIFERFDPRDCVPMEHDGDWFPDFCTL